MGRHGGSANLIIGDPVFAVLVRSDIDADDTARPVSPRQPIAGGGLSVIVEAHAIDHGFVFGEPEQARLGIARLRLWRDGADLDMAEAEAEHFGENFGVFIETRRKADGIGEVDTGELDLERGRRGWRRTYRRGLQSRDRQAVRAFAV